MSGKIAETIKAALGRVLRDVKAHHMLIVFFAAYNILVRKIFKAFCLQLIITGFPCPGCGMTRAVFCILTGQVERGLRLNPAVVFWIVLLIWYGWNRYVCGVHPGNAMRWLGVVSAVTLLIYIYRMANFFPGAPPMVYNRNNIIRRLLIFGRCGSAGILHLLQSL